MSSEKIAQCFEGIVDIQRHIVGINTGQPLAERIVKSAHVADFLKGASNGVRIPLTAAEFKTAITATGTQNDPLTNTLRPSIAEGARRRLLLRDLLIGAPTNEAAIEYPTEASFTNNAGSQNGQNTALSESGLTFSLSFQPVETIGHYVHVSKNVLQDSGVLDAFLRSRLLYGLRLEEENQILNGNGSSGELDGILNTGNFTAFNRTQSPLDTARDTIGRALTQVELADYDPNGIVLNPVDWETIKLSLKNENVQYRLFGVPVAVSNSITSGTFLVGDFTRGAVLFDRQEASIEVSEYHDSNFEKGLVTLLATERVGLVVTNPGALIKGSL